MIKHRIVAATFATIGILVMLSMLGIVATAPTNGPLYFFSLIVFGSGVASHWRLMYSSQVRFYFQRRQSIEDKARANLPPVKGVEAGTPPGTDSPITGFARTEKK